MRTETAKYFRIKDTKGEDYFIAAKDSGAIGRFLRKPGYTGADPSRYCLADALGFELDSLAEIDASETRFAERYEQLMAKGTFKQDVFLIGHPVDPRENLALRGEAQLLKV
jgi:hypothetical protein